MMCVCAGVYAMQAGMCRRVGAGVQVLCGYVCVQVRCAMQICANGRYVLCNAMPANMGRNQGKMMENGRRSLQNRGIVDILYDGFRKCFVNCKFTFYITLSSYLKKVKIPKTSKNHSKM